MTVTMQWQHVKMRLDPFAPFARALPLNYQTFRRDVFYPMLKTAGIRRVRIHDLSAM